MSRIDRHSRSTGNQQQEKTARPSSIGTDSIDVEALPPRRKKYPSSSMKVTKWYYNLLFILFVSLVAFLFWYGIRFSE